MKSLEGISSLGSGNQGGNGSGAARLGAPGGQAGHRAGLRVGGHATRPAQGQERGWDRRLGGVCLSPPPGSRAQQLKAAQRAVAGHKGMPSGRRGVRSRRPQAAPDSPPCCWGLGDEVRPPSSRTAPRQVGPAGGLPSSNPAGGTADTEQPPASGSRWESAQPAAAPPDALTCSLPLHPTLSPHPGPSSAQDGMTRILPPGAAGSPSSSRAQSPAQGARPAAPSVSSGEGQGDVCVHRSAVRGPRGFPGWPPGGLVPSRDFSPPTSRMHLT